MMASMNQSTLRASAFFVIAIALVAGGYFYQNQLRVDTAQTNASVEASSSNAVFAAVTKSDTVGGSTNIIPITDSGLAAQAIYKAPTYPKTLSFTGKLSDSEKAAMQKAYVEVTGDLAKDKLDYNAWISMGTLNLMAGNLKTAESVWIYASAQWPTNHASHNNLGDLYMNYMKEYPKAEKEFLAGIVNKSGDPNPYKNLFTLYSETSYKPTNTAAEDILKKGIIAVPTSVDLKYMLAVYYRKLGRAQDASAQFQAAINEANKQGLTQIAAQIKTDIANGK